MISVESYTTFILASALLSIAPGPDNIFVLTQSALYGRRSGLMVMLGLFSGVIFHTALVAFGVAAIFQTSMIAFTLLKLLGAIYLLYLAWQAFFSDAAKLDGRGVDRQSPGALYRRGIIMNVTNPKVSIFFLAFLPQFISTQQGNVIQQVFILGGLFLLAALPVFLAVALLAGSLGEWLKKSKKGQVYLMRMAGFIFVVLACKFFFLDINAE